MELIEPIEPIEQTQIQGPLTFFVSILSRTLIQMNFLCESF